MKKEIKYAVFALSVIIFTAAAYIAQDNPLPTVRGDEAIEKLKQKGQYDSLMDAVKAARKNSGETEADAVGQTAKLIGSDGANGDSFGGSVAISGNTAVAGGWGDDIGANQAQGSVFVFVRNGTTWTEQQKLTASDGAEADGFGIDVAIDGDTIIVGAWHDDVGGNESQGSAYVFVRSGTTWTEQQRLIASDGGIAAEFGKSVAIDGDTAVAGAHQGGMNEQGAAYIFVRSGTVWTQQQKLTASDGAAFDFLTDVAISGDTVIAGASGDDIGGNIDQGSAYVFVRSGTVWTEQQKLTAADGTGNDFFGGVQTLAIEGNTAVVGAKSDDVGANSDQGSVYIFIRSGTTWTQQQKLTASDGAPASFFGTVAIDGDTLIVGASGVNVGLNAAVGSAYIFVRSGTTWTERQQIIASDGADSDRFGNSVAVSGNKIFVGAADANIGMQNDQGVAYVFISKVTVGGRIVMSDGVSGVTNANVQLTLANGGTRYTLSTSFGYYRFDEIEADQIVTVSVSSKRFQFTPQMVQVDDNVTNVDFTALP